VRHVTRTGKTRNSYDIVNDKSNEKRLLKDPGREKDENVKN